MRSLYLMLGLPFALFALGCADPGPLNSLEQKTFTGDLKSAPGQEAEELGLVPGRYGVAIGKDGKALELKSLDGAERVFHMNEALGKKDVQNLKIKNPRRGQKGRGPLEVSFELPASATLQPFNMAVEIKKEVLSTHKKTQEEDCTKTLCDEEDGDDCDGTTDVTYRTDQIRYRVAVGFTRGGVERDDTLIATLEGHTQEFPDKYEIDRTLCW